MASTAYHLAKYSIQQPKNNLKKGVLIFSIDVDVGDKTLGVLNGGKNDANVHKYLSEYQIGEIEEFALPQFINAFDQHEVPATFAIRGQLVETNFSVTKIFGSKTNHKIASHSYSHKSFNPCFLLRKQKRTYAKLTGNEKVRSYAFNFSFIHATE